MTKYLIVNADDFGLSPGVNRGIVEAFRAGSVTSTSIMVNMPGFEEAVRFARLVPELGVGLHFNLTYGKPVSDSEIVPSLVDSDGKFHAVNSGCPRDERDVQTELAAQWSRLEAAGLRATHLDSHHLLHQNHPSIYRVMTAWAERVQTPLRRTQSLTDPAEQARPIAMTDRLLLDVYEGPDALERLLRYLNELSDGTTELVCHPGYVDGIVRSISKWTDVREAELAVFRDPAVSGAIRSLGICPIHFGQLREKQLEEAAAAEAEASRAEILPIAPELKKAAKKRTRPASKLTARRSRRTGGRSGARTVRKRKRRRG